MRIQEIVRSSRTLAVAAVVGLGLSAVGRYALSPSNSIRDGASHAQESRAPAAQSRTSSAASASTEPGPDGRVPVDFFHPDHQPGKDGRRPALPEPAYGGRAVVHLEAMPPSLCYPIENSGITRRILYEVNETLLQRDWDTCEVKPSLCKRFEVEDTLVLKNRSAPDYSVTRIGRFQEKGDVYRRIRDVGYATDDVLEIPKDEVDRIEKSTVFTFDLRDDVRWHDGHPFDARDVVFSAEIYKNPFLDCGEKRFQFDKITKVEMLGPHKVRVYYANQYFQALASIGDLCMLPSHLYNLSDPENAKYDPEYHAQKRAENESWRPSEKEQAEYIAKNPHNRAWIGLGPYKIVKWDADAVDAERFDGYFDRSRAGYLDAIRWRNVPSDDAALQAVLNGELDYFGRVSGADYFGDATQSATFTDRLYKGHVYSGVYSYTAWNLLRPKFADVRVREALARLFDFDEFRRAFYKGLAEQVTGPESPWSPAYNHDVKPFPYSPDVAKDLLTKAGWYDRDGDGIIDKDGTPFEIELLSNAGNKTNEQFALKYQENLARVGIKLTYVPLEWATLLDRRGRRDFDALALSWLLPFESDPEQYWHSKWADPKERGSNCVGLKDAEVDALIERGQRELDVAKRTEIWHQLHARLYALQPYLFGYSTPKKFAVNKKLRGYQTVKLDPNYVIRRWYYPAGTPGTRATLEKK